ncbi:hypothetical protein E4T42_09536 [Aureobasidium subglaciale]|nr:hypothetical protein E4T42_09536 [Aureobasidium subglaciale]
MAFHNGVQKRSAAKPYLPPTHDIDGLLAALENDALAINKEHDHDAPIKLEVDHSYVSYLEDSFATDVPSPAPSLVLNVKTEVDSGALRFVVKHESRLPNLFPEVKMEDIEVIDLCSDAETDDGLEQESRSRVSSISNTSFEHDQRSRVISGKRRLDKETYTKVIGGERPENKIKSDDVVQTSEHKRPTQARIRAMARKTYKACKNGHLNGLTSRKHFEAILEEADRKDYLGYVGRMKGLEGFDWTNPHRLSLLVLAASTLSRSDEQEKQLLDDLGAFRNRFNVRQYLAETFPIRHPEAHEAKLAAEEKSQADCVLAIDKQQRKREEDHSN